MGSTIASKAFLTLLIVGLHALTVAQESGAMKAVCVGQSVSSKLSLDEKPDEEEVPSVESNLRRFLTPGRKHFESVNLCLWPIVPIVPSLCRSFSFLHQTSL